MPKSIEYRTQAFLQEAKDKFKNKFDYSLVNYYNNNTKVKIICPIHGEFEQIPYSHLQSKYGCPKCGTIHSVTPLKSNTSDFIKKSTKKHGDKYDYSLVEYVDQKTKIKIICPIHGEFEQVPKKHLSGNGCKRCSKRIDNNIIREKLREIHGDKYSYGEFDYKNHLEKIKITCPIHGEFYTSLNNHISRRSGCPKCSSTESQFENRIKLHLIEKSVKVKERCRNIIPPKELDFYLPDYNLAIEINGIYWHSELQGKDKNYHLNKTNLCKERGINLLHYTDYQIRNKWDIIKSQLNSILNINKRKLHGRKCEVREIDSKLKSNFLNKYHLQGNDKAPIKLGLFYKNRLVSVMTFCKRRVALGKKLTEEGEYELSRYCGNFNFYVIGGASKLLKYFERNYKPTKIVTYADKSRSIGDLYYKLGFKFTHDSKPNYWYFKNDEKLYHRFNFRKAELSKKLETFDPNKSEWENMINNGWNRIWDCGNMVFEKNYL